MRSRRRRWWWRGGASVAAYAGAMLLTGLLRGDPDPVRVALVVAVAAAAFSVALDASTPPLATWPLDPPPTTGLARNDRRTAASLRLLEGHLTAAEPDGALRDRLRALADQALRTRHELSVDDPRAPVLLGAELSGVLQGPPRRLDPDLIERLVSRIEHL